MLCILDHNGRKVKSLTIRGPWEKVLDYLRDFKEPFSVCFEASTGYVWLNKALQPLARNVQVAHPGKARMIFQSKRKTDRIDAEKLAKLLYLDEVPPVHVPSEDVRSWRGLIEHRSKKVASRTAIKNKIRAFLRTHAIRSPKSLWSKKGLAWLKELSFEAAPDELQRDILLCDLQHYTNQLKLVEAALYKIAARHPGATLLRTIPGVGIRTAEAVVAYIDDPGRFSRIKAIGAYFGLVPCEDSSAGKQRLGHITREGPSTVRRLLTEAAWQSIRRSKSMKVFYERVMQGDPKRKKSALVATAHRMLRAMLAMLRTGETWKEAA